MCGIAGICSQSKSIDEEKFRKALGCLRHRGPEGEGIWLDQQIPVALGHRRLRIIDLSAQAAQPMDYGNRYRIVHNGELYNYIELRQELEKSGSSFLPTPIQKSSWPHMQHGEEIASRNLMACLPLPSGMKLKKNYLQPGTASARNLFFITTTRNGLCFPLNRKHCGSWVFQKK